MKPPNGRTSWKGLPYGSPTEPSGLAYGFIRVSPGFAPDAPTETVVGPRVEITNYSDPSSIGMGLPQFPLALVVEVGVKEELFVKAVGAPDASDSRVPACYLCPLTSQDFKCRFVIRLLAYLRDLLGVDHPSHLVDDDHGPGHETLHRTIEDPDPVVVGKSAIPES